MTARIGTLAAVLFLVLCGAARAHSISGAPRCPIFPADSPWNQRVDRLPVDPRSDAIVAAIGAGKPFHPDFGTRYGIPFTTVSAKQRRVPVRFEYADESDRGPYPIPRTVPIENGSDAHALIVDPRPLPPA